MATAGPNFPSTGASSGGIIAWTNPGNIISTNGAVASQNSSTTATNNAFLRATGFGFSIPSGSVINGISVTITRDRTAGTTGNIVDDTVQLLVSGTPSGSNLAATGTNWPTTLTAATYGSTTNLWGLSLAPSDINNTNFGVQLRVDNTGNRTANVDSISITITYTPPTPTPTPTQSVTPSVTSSVTPTPTPTLTPTPSITASSNVNINNAFEAEAFSVDGNVLIMSGFSDPTITNPIAPVSSLYLRAGATTNPYVYLKTATGWISVY